MTTYVLAPQIKFGLSGTATYKVYTYDSGGLVAADTWSDNGTTLNANPVVLDANGRAPIYIQAGKSYRFIYKTAADVTIDDVDPVAVADPAAGTGIGTTGTDLTLTGDLTVVNITATGDGTIGGDLTVGGDVTITGDTISNGIKLTALPPGFRNGTIDATAAANAITINYETQASATPSTTDPVTVTRRHQTITTGSTHNVNQTAALTLTIPSGATLGCASSEAVRIHLGLIRNAGSALELACWTAAVAASTFVQSFDPAELVTSSAIGTGSDSTQTIYSTTARTSQPMVYLGYIEATSGATAGQWSSVDKIVNWEPGVPFPGSIIQVQLSQTGAAATGTTTTPSDDSIPQITEGDQVMSKTVTAKSAINRFTISSVAQVSHTVANTSVTHALHQGAIADALAASQMTMPTALSNGHPILDHFMVTGSTSQITFRIREGANQAGTLTFNGASGVRAMGGVMNSFLKIVEIHA